ncbi:hypothetical protein K469DRAFT_753409 [Zopfia rhizophila CBS 207.26]|uniref:Uncharacterized protein n=1 Tax=Zopfia rhizophila CBS 207.26 TaxID=1314779 RepID=A0A6A6DQC8_9PEZI|nr:hypothetical protein K469DRAFT_753409 [Zopfia rhizophila CBS 207.26]
MKSGNRRFQNLEVIHVSRLEHKNPRVSKSRIHRALFDHWWISSQSYLAVSAAGWMVLIGAIFLNYILDCYLALAFLVAVPFTGSVVLFLHGSRPRRLLSEKGSRFNRLVVVAAHMNETNWKVFYGESSLVNSLLNLPLCPTKPRKSPAVYRYWRMILRILILSQWALALGAASTKDWNAYITSFWITICILSHAYLFSPERGARAWMKHLSNIQFDKYQTQLSSRMALLSAITVLNPDTFPWEESTERQDWATPREEALKWVDPILKSGQDRNDWEKATCAAMKHAATRHTLDQLASDMG